MINIGDNVIYKPNEYRNNKVTKNISHRWYNAKAKVIETETLNRFWISFDEFPNCNCRDRVNRFVADETELEKY